MDPETGKASVFERRRILLIGGAGQPNYGDELIALRTAQWWQAQSCEPIVCGFRASVLTSIFQMHDTSVPVLDSIWAATGSHETIRLAYEHGLKFPERSPFDNDAMELLESILNRVHAIHFIGGGYLDGIWPRGAFLLALGIALKERRNIGLFATGLGLLPLSNVDAVQMAEIADRFDIFECRDAKSAATLRTAGSRYVIGGCDDCFIGPAGAERGGPGRHLHISIQLGQMPPNQRQCVVNKLSTLLDAVGNEFDAIVIWPLHPSSDKEVVDALDERYRAKTTTISFTALMQGGFRARQGDGAIASRFHAHLLLARLGIAGLFIEGPNCVENPEYYAVKHRTLQESGSGWECFEEIEPFQVMKIFDRGCDKDFEENHRLLKKSVYADMLRRFS
jgi:polysaccharide pyruvyl transferase WcaK-like protein